MNKQAAFNVMTAHILKQGKPAKNLDTNSCRYRTPEGLKCAVGCLIPDEKYCPSLEGKDPFNQEVIEALPPELATKSAFLKDCQIHLHDSLSALETISAEELRKGVNQVMSLYKDLKVPPCL